MRGWQLHEVNGMLDNPFHGNCWRKKLVWRDTEGRDNEVRFLTAVNVACCRW